MNMGTHLDVVAVGAGGVFSPLVEAADLSLWEGHGPDVTRSPDVSTRKIFFGFDFCFDFHFKLPVNRRFLKLPVRAFYFHVLFLFSSFISQAFLKTYMEIENDFIQEQIYVLHT